MLAASDALPLWTAGIFVGLIVSCLIASAAGRGTAGGWAWGLFGPPGWIIAALHDLGDRVSARGERGRIEPRVTTRPTAPIAGPRAARGAGSEPPRGAVFVACESCGFQAALFPRHGCRTPCPDCGKPIEHHSAQEPLD